MKMNDIDIFIEEFMKNHVDNRKPCCKCKYMLSLDNFSNKYGRINVTCDKCLKYNYEKNMVYYYNRSERVKTSEKKILDNYSSRVYNFFYEKTFDYLGCSTDEYISFINNMLDEDIDIHDYMITWKTIFIKPITKLMSDEQIIKRLHYSNISIKYL